jgi:hypothetical protein
LEQPFLTRLAFPNLNESANKIHIKPLEIRLKSDRKMLVETENSSLRRGKLRAGNANQKIGIALNQVTESDVGKVSFQNLPFLF